MTSSPVDSTDIPNEAVQGAASSSSEVSPTISPTITPDPQVIEAESEIVASTPKTIPLKRETAFFVPAVLPEQTKDSVDSDEVTLSDIKSAEVISAEVNPTAESEIAPETTTAELNSKSSSLCVEFSLPPDATYQASLTLELRCSDPNAIIYYGQNVEDVGEDGLLYNPEEKIFLTQSSSIVARAFVDGQGGPLAVGHFEINKPGWQKIEPLDQSDATPHELCEAVGLEGSWRLAAASVRGKLHAHRGLWREDAFRHGLAHSSDGTYSVIVVSDGAGSVPLSRVGSNLLCQVALDFLLGSLVQVAPLNSDTKTLVENDLPQLRSLLVESAKVALQKLREEAATRNRPLSDFSSTLLVLIRREWNGQQLCAALQAGDGSIALWNDDQTLTILGEADHGEHSSETKFLTTSGMEAELHTRIKFSIRPNLRAVAVMTDGVSDDFFPERTRFPELFGTVLTLLEQSDERGSGEALLDWINYEKKGSSDDRTLVLCWKGEVKNGNQ